MRARIKPKTSARIPEKIIKDEQYARDFYNAIKEINANANLGNSFDEWYEKIKLADFYWKIVDAETAIKGGK